MDSPIVSAAEMRAAEEAAFARGIEVEALMDQAGAGVARAIQQFLPHPGECVVYAGKGHNGGDALAAATCLHGEGWKIDIRLPFPESDYTELTRKKLIELRTAIDKDGGKAATSKFRPEFARTIILDGLLGVGAKSFLREPLRATTRELNALRISRNAFVFAVDLPSGFDGDSGEIDPDSVMADFTITIGFVKHGLITDGAIDYVGRIVIVPLPDLEVGNNRNEFMATAQCLSGLIPPRKFGAYKNQFGRIGVVAGSKGFVGAALMTATGALRAGAGLVEMFVPEDIYDVVASAAPPEVMVKPTRYRDLLEKEVDVWAIGPGLGTANGQRIRDLIERAEQPMVIDADGLNILSEQRDLLKRCRGPRLLTPHPGEMERLFPAGKMTRAGVARSFCEEYPVTLVLKGSRTVVSQREKPLSFNTTGNPGMATGGMGDVLTGVCAGLIEQGISFYDVGRISAWLCGRSAELAIFHGEHTSQTLLPTDVLKNLGRAMKELDVGFVW